MQGNAEKSRIIMVGDTLKKASESSSEGKLVEIKDFGDAEYESAFCLPGEKLLQVENIVFRE